MADADTNDIYSVTGLAFSDRPELGQQVLAAIAQTPTHQDLFLAIGRYILSRTAVDDALPDGADADANDRPAKRRRIKTEAPAPAPAPAQQQTAADALSDEPALVTVRDVSFALPQRKKLVLEFTATGLRGGSGSGGTGAGAVDAPPAFAVRAHDIQRAICVPVPEKTPRQYYLAIFVGDGGGVERDPLLWTVPDKTAALTTTGPHDPDPDRGYRTVMIEQLERLLLPRSMRVQEPDEREFVSAVVQAHRKEERVTHVKAFRGIKDGFLYFLPTGILWGFRKPLLFFAMPDILSVSYTSVLQRTFDLNLSHATAPADALDATATPTTATATATDLATATTDFVFSMIDQADFAGIDAYVKRHGLHDASMAERRRAAPIAGRSAVKAEEEEEVPLRGRRKDGEQGVNGVERKEEDEEEEDDEDEGGENYDPGSEGQSEGSGSATSDDEDDDGDGVGDGEGDGDGEGVAESDDGERETDGV
ncbi:MAG: hypothetical protein M1826_005554 [Phylliscum demangeonii]|nr:MAG: hypothetical protein M1826_005554 [Phylliscum demangeonii]